MKFLFITISLIIPLLSKGQKVITQIESVQSLYIEVSYINKRLACGTGFIIKSKTQYYLITNWHVVTGKYADTKNWIDTSINQQVSPTKICIFYYSKNLNTIIKKYEPLIDSKEIITYKEYKIGNEMVDVVAIPLKDTSGVSIFSVDYKKTNEEVILTPMELVSIIGFPHGRKGSFELPIWKSGLIASEPDIDQDNKPIMWVDVDVYPGMSGSPVYYISKNYVMRDGMDE